MNVSDEQVAAFWYASRKTTSLMDRWGDKLFRDELGVGLSTFLVLSVIDARPGEFNQQRVADALGITKGTISRQIEQGIAAGLISVETSPTSRRDNVVGLTASGTALVRRGDTVFAARRAQVFGDLDGDELAAATRVLDRLIARMSSQPPDRPTRHG